MLYKVVSTGTELCAEQNFVVNVVGNDPRYMRSHAQLSGTIDEEAGPRSGKPNLPAQSSPA